MGAGKGDTPRPLSVSCAEFARRWNRIFAEKTCTVCGLVYESTQAPAVFNMCARCWDNQIDLEENELCPVCHCELNWCDQRFVCNDCGWVSDGGERC